MAALTKFPPVGGSTEGAGWAPTGSGALFDYSGNRIGGGEKVSNEVIFNWVVDQHWGDDVDAVAADLRATGPYPKALSVMGKDPITRLETVTGDQFE